MKGKHIEKKQKMTVINYIGNTPLKNFTCLDVGDAKNVVDAVAIAKADIDEVTNDMWISIRKAICSLSNNQLQYNTLQAGIVSDIIENEFCRNKKARFLNSMKEGEKVG
jgi:hypothetical protein